MNPEDVLKYILPSDRSIFDIQDSLMRIKGTRVSTGACRTVIVFDTFVIKLDRDSCERACEKENLFYQTAQRFGCSEILLPTTLIHTIEEYGIKIFSQPKYSRTESEVERLDVKGRYDKCTKTIPDYSEIIRGRRHLMELPHIWVERAYSIYGKKAMTALSKWIQYCRVNDLHRANVGYVKHRPIISDYAGYRNW